MRRITKGLQMAIQMAICGQFRQDRNSYIYIYTHVNIYRDTHTQSLEIPSCYTTHSLNPKHPLRSFCDFGAFTRAFSNPLHRFDPIPSSLCHAGGLFCLADRMIRMECHSFHLGLDMFSSLCSLIGVGQISQLQSYSIPSNLRKFHHLCVLLNHSLLGQQFSTIPIGSCSH